MVLVLRGSDLPSRSGAIQMLEIAHIPKSMLAEGGCIERDFRKRDEGKPGSTSR